MTAAQRVAFIVCALIVVAVCLIGAVPALAWIGRGIAGISLL